MRAPRRFLVAAIASLLLVPLAACGGSPSTPTPPPPPQPGITYRSSASPAPANSIVLETRSSDPQQITLALRANAVTDLYGVALDIRFNTAIVSFESFRARDFLESEGASMSTQVVENPAGTLVIGQSKIGAVDGSAGTGDMLVLTFRALTAGTSAITIANQGAYDPDGSITSTSFFGGTLTVVQ
jgi:hypothetical protein